MFSFMTKSLRDKMESVESKRHKKIEVRAQQLIAEEMALRELRKAHHRTQVSMAKQLGISQDGVSRLEKRSDPAFYFAQLCRGDGR